MKEYISFDSHKHYTLVEQENRRTKKTKQCRIDHSPGAIRRFLEKFCEPGTPVAVESIGSWYWIVDEIEQAGLRPLLVHPRKAKLMMGMINKTDKLDVHGLNRLQRNDVLPTVWIPPGELRDQRELTRTRIVLVQQRTRLKNRITSTLTKYNLQLTGFSDSYGRKARPELEARISRLPSQACSMSDMLLAHMDFANSQIAEVDKRMKELVRLTPEMKLLKTLPGIADLLASTICLEIGDIGRFASAGHLASYAGTTPRVHSSGGKTRYGRLRPDANRFLRWGFVEAANSVAVNHRRLPDRHVSILYARIRHRRNHSKSIGAVARHLAEACFHVWSKNEPYRDPALPKRSSQGGVSADLS